MLKFFEPFMSTTHGADENGEETVLRMGTHEKGGDGLEHGKAGEGGDGIEN